MTPTLTQRLAAETIGTAFLVLALVGGGLMASEAQGAPTVLSLAAVGIGGGVTLAIMINMLGPISGGHFNPAVTVVFALRNEISWQTGGYYIAAQIAGGLIGVGLANVMFGHGLFEISTTSRLGGGLWLGEVLATFALVFAVLMTIAKAPGTTAWAVGGILAAGHFFTASGAFANPAVTIARLFTNSFTGIDAASVIPFVIAELVGGVLALGAAGFLIAAGTAAPAPAAKAAELPRAAKAGARKKSA
ncbi:MAG: aquaporin [Bauldia sp.]|nr:aquaporin [Bauldia sp.]